jgi:membrane fusion protein (multidrug efflux system)
MKVAQRPVTLGETAANNVVVSKGLAAGDQVVVDGILKVQPGAIVKATPINLDADATESADGGKARS